ncbi:MAG: LysR family transcriptional regulator [Coriobacteriales bacterium]
MLFDDVKVLIVLSEAKSLSQAAEQLYMSRPGLSQKINNLEVKFGTKLFERTSSGIKMTRAGELATDFARNVSDLERGMAAQLAAIDESFVATINVGMSINDGVALLPKLVADYVAGGHPDERVHLDAGYEPDLVEKLHSGDLAFALLENQPQEPGLNIELLGYKKLIFVGPNKPPYNQVVHPLPVETLIKWPMIIYEWNSGRHMVGNRHFRERYGLSLNDHNMIACFDTHDAMMEGVKAGLGWGSVPECVYQRYKDDPEVVRFKVSTPPMWYPVSLVWSTEHVMKDNARDFLNYVRANIPEGYFRKDVEAYLNS